MTRLTWGELEKRNFEYGVDRGVFYAKNGVGYAWQGLVSVKESIVDESRSLIYVDGVGHRNILAIGSFAAIISAITFPDEFEIFDGYDDKLTAQGQRPFDFSYRTMQANGHYKIHLVYNALAIPTARNNSSLNPSNDAALFSWNLSTSPEAIPGAKASSHFVIDTTQVNPGVIAAIEDRIYGTDASFPDMPQVPELLEIFEEFAVFRVTPHGDGTVTVSGPDSAVYEVSPSLWKLDWPSVIQVAEHKYRATSL